MVCSRYRLRLGSSGAVYRAGTAARRAAPLDLLSAPHYRWGLHGGRSVLWQAGVCCQVRIRLWGSWREGSVRILIPNFNEKQIFKCFNFDEFVWIWILLNFNPSIKKKVSENCEFQIFCQPLKILIWNHSAPSSSMSTSTGWMCLIKCWCDPTLILDSSDFFWSTHSIQLHLSLVPFFGT